MPDLPITGLYAALMSMMAVGLVIRVIQLRGRFRQSLGDGGHAHLNRRIRAHGNFVETVPLALILIALCEAGSMPGWALHGLGILLLAGRLAHAAALEPETGRMRLRQLGMMASFAVLALPVPWLVWRYVSATLT